MTKLRPAGSIRQAIHYVIGCLGAGVEAAAGKSLRRLHEWSDPDEPASLPIDVAVRLDRACLAAGHGNPLLDAYRLQVRGPGIQPAPHLTEGVLLALTTAEIGDIARSLVEALADGRLSAAERGSLLIDIHEARTCLDQLAACIADAPNGPASSECLR